MIHFRNNVCLMSFFKLFFLCVRYWIDEKNGQKIYNLSKQLNDKFFNEKNLIYLWLSTISFITLNT
jgi:cbb3-type cytochrome oxidase subunit 3